MWKLVTQRGMQALMAPLRADQGEAIDLVPDLARGGGALTVLGEAWQAMLARIRLGLERVAVKAIQLSGLAPRLAELAEALDADASTQHAASLHMSEATALMARTVHTMAQHADQAAGVSQQVAAATQAARQSGVMAGEELDKVRRVVDHLSDSLAALQRHSASIASTMALIHSVTERTKLLSLNAAIEAARAGEQGRGFAIVADEIRKLADQTKDATQRVGLVLTSIRDAVTELSQQALAVQGTVAHGLDAATTAHSTLYLATDAMQTLIQRVGQIADACHTQQQAVADASVKVHRVAEAARSQQASASAVKQVSLQVRALSDELLVALGAFHLDAHHAARNSVEQLAAELGGSLAHQADLERRMQAALRLHPEFELVYVTNALGVQITRNIGPAARTDDAAARGRNWSSRPWFRAPAEQGGTHVSGIYRSLATDNFCFTVSTPLQDEAGQLAGVLGVDIHFDQILARGAP